MSKKTAMLLALLVLLTRAFAQQIHQPPAGSQTESVNCAFTFSSGSGHGATQYCVTANGNIAQFTMTGLNLLPSESSAD
jgi:hypothetical protein